MHVQCAELSEKLAEDLASEGLKGKTITLKLKETNFEVRTRNITLTRHISSREDVLHEALKLLRAELPITIRLMVRYLKVSRCTITCVNLPFDSSSAWLAGNTCCGRIAALPAFDACQAVVH